MQDFHSLVVWQKAHALAMDLYRLAGDFPRSHGAAFTSQLRRAALSVPACIVEGSAKTSDAEFRRFLAMAMGSAAEAEYHLLAARDLGIVPNETHDSLSARLIEVRRMLGGLMRKLQSDIDDA